MRNIMLVGQPDDLFRIGLAQADMLAREQSDCPRETPAVAVEHRQHPKVCRVVLHRPRNRICSCIEICAPMMRDNALWVAGGTRRIRNGYRIPFVVGPSQMCHLYAVINPTP